MTGDPMYDFSADRDIEQQLLPSRAVLDKDPEEWIDISAAVAVVVVVGACLIGAFLLWIS